MSLSEEPPSEVQPSEENITSCADGNCEEVIREVYGHLDGEFDAERRRLVQAHLDSCEPCFSAFDFHSELRRLVSSGCKADLPDGLRDRVFAALETFGDAPEPTTG